MDRKNISQHWKEFRTYWGLVMRRAIPNAWVRVGGFFAIVVPLVIGVMQSLQTKPFESFPEFMARSDMMGYFVFIGLALLFALLLFSLEPVKLYEEQGGFEDGKLVVTPSWTATNEIEQIWFGFELTNVANEDIEQCYVEVTQVTKTEDATFQINQFAWLKWSSLENESSDGKKAIKLGDTRRIDVIMATKGNISFQVQKTLPYSSDKGHFHVRFVIKGVYRKSPLKVPFDLDLEYDGDETFVCKQKEVEIMLKKGKRDYEVSSVKAF